MLGAVGEQSQSDSWAMPPISALFLEFLHNFVVFFSQYNKAVGYSERSMHDECMRQLETTSKLQH